MPLILCPLFTDLFPLHLVCAVTARHGAQWLRVGPRTMETGKDIGCPSLVEVLEPMLHEYGIYDVAAFASVLRYDHQALPTTLPARHVVLRRRHQRVPKATLRHKPPA